MWLVALTRTLLIAAATAQTGDSPAAPRAGELPPVISTRQTLFSIPFRVDGPPSPADEPRQIELHVSLDGGGRWTFHSAAPPRQSQFLFRADRDGEYWFAIRTIDASGEGRPSQVDRPGLRVIVDTVPPKLSLEAARGTAGQITVRWLAVEPYLAPESFTLQYRADSTQPWQAVAIDRQTLNSTGPERSGEVTWMPQGNSSRVEVRAEASDTAGNRDVCHAQVAINPDPPAGYHVQGTGSQPGVLPGTSLPESGWRTAEQNTRYAGLRNGTESYRDEPEAGQAATTASDPVTGQDHTPRPAESDPATTPAPPQPQVVNSPLFDLEYNVHAEVPGAYVELWGTRDNGENWTSFGIDSDGRSPIVVRVPAEGLYGFRFVVRSPQGILTPPPRGGDMPEIWIGVDATRPQVRILSTEQDLNGRASQLLVRWQASDAMLADHPVSLSVGSTPNGPWTIVATGLDNTGSYEWRIDSQAPPQAFLRLEIRDAAGNVGAATTERPIELTRTNSESRAYGYEPDDQAQRPGPRRYYFR